MTAFTSTTRSRVKRLHQRAAYDRETIYPIVDAALVCHVSYVIDDQPYVTPTCHWREGDRLYWHGSSASRMMRKLREGVPACLTVSHLDGLVLARSGFHSSINYRCVMAFGSARTVEDKTDKLRALEAFVERLTPGRWAELRPVTEQELKATLVVSMEIEEASAKLRSGPPADDEEDYVLDVWAGVVPVRQVIEPPRPDPHLKAGLSPPAYLGGICLG